MICAIDIGNSSLKAGLFEGDELRDTFRISLEQGEDAIVAAFAKRIRNQELTALGISSVVPAVSTSIAEAAAARDIRVFLVAHSAMLPFELAYRTPETMGVDRIAAAAGAWEGFGGTTEKPIVVVDAGTAVTIDVLSDGAMLGGSIIPGPELMRRAVRSGTAQLPIVDLEWPPRAIAQTTREAVAAGIMYSFVDGVRGVLLRIVDEIGTQPRVIATGGWGKLLSEKIELIGLFDPDLVVRGVAALLRDNTPEG